MARSKSVSCCATSRRPDVSVIIEHSRPVALAPTVIVDDSSGYKAYIDIPLGYRNGSIEYSNIKETMGINFYCSSESIGACIFVDGVMISITDMSIEQFFGVSIQNPNVSLVSAMQIEDDTIYVAAIMNTGDSNIVFSSKTISYSGLLLSIPIKIEHSTTSEKEREEHKSIFDDDGVLIKESDKEYYSHENYSGSHGFSDMRLVEIQVDVTSPMIDIMSQVGLDIGISDDFYAVESVTIDDRFYIISLHKDKLMATIGMVDKVIVFKNQLKQTEFDNAYSSPIRYIIPDDYKKAYAYRTIYVPAGIIKRYVKPSRIIFCREEEKQSVYEITVKHDNNIYYLDLKDEMEPIEEHDKSSRFSCTSKYFEINTDKAMRNLDTSQEWDDIKSVKSVANFLTYGNFG